jgi:hypothetical protein
MVSDLLSVYETYNAEFQNSIADFLGVENSFFLPRRAEICQIFYHKRHFNRQGASSGGGRTAKRHGGMRGELLRRLAIAVGPSRFSRDGRSVKIKGDKVVVS